MGSEYKWRFLLDYDFGVCSYSNCSQYCHYLDAVVNNIDPFDEEDYPNFKTYGYHSPEKDVFMYAGIYIKEAWDIPIGFDYGCSVAVTPEKDDFCELINSVNKTIEGLGSTVSVKGEGLIGRSFRDDY